MPTLRRMSPSPRERLKALLRTVALKRGHFILASGAESSYYLDVRLISTHPEGALLVAQAFLELLKDEPIAAVGGPVLGAAPLVGALASESFRAGHPLPVFLVRKEAKGHGTGRQIEGHFHPGDAVALIEDVVTGGGSVLRAVEAVREAGGRVTRVLAVVDRGAGGREALTAAGVRFDALFAVAELLDPVS